MKNSDYRLIKIENLQVFAHHGVYEEETKAGQNFFINALLYLDAHSAGILADDLEKTVNYAEACQFMTDFMVQNTCKLIERAAELLARALMEKYPLIQMLKLEIRKPEAPIGLPFESVSVERMISRHVAYLSLGSNIGDTRGYIFGAIDALGAESHTKVERVSEMLVTKPYGYLDQDDFLNCAVKINTILSARELLDFIHDIEQAANRTREIHWGPRTLDIDIVFYDDEIISEDDFNVPHIDMQNREFVLKPMAEIAPFYRHPILGKTVEEMLEDLNVLE